MNPAAAGGPGCPPAAAAMTLTSYNSTDGIATITLDDGKVNALSPEMLAEIGAQFERAEKEGRRRGAHRSGADVLGRV
jgi:enoyl-CoA hydratase/carnithine racemase